MTWSAPIDRTRSTFAVLHTPVTCAPNALAICTPNVPTPPDAPTTSTRWPAWTRPRSRRACRAVTADTGTAAACSKVRNFRAARLDHPRDLRAKSRGLGPPHAVAGDAHQVRQPGHDVP